MMNERRPTKGTLELLELVQGGVGKKVGFLLSFLVYRPHHAFANNSKRKVHILRRKWDIFEIGGRKRTNAALKTGQHIL